VYSLGVLAYEALAGRPPFVAGTPVDILLKHVSETPKPPSTWKPVPPDLDRLIVQMLAKDPLARPDLDVVRTQFERAAKFTPQQWAKRQFRRSRSLLFALAAAAVVISAVAIPLFRDSATTSSPAVPRADTMPAAAADRITQERTSSENSDTPTIGAVGPAAIEPTANGEDRAHAGRGDGERGTREPRDEKRRRSRRQTPTAAPAAPAAPTLSLPRESEDALMMRPRRGGTE